MRVKVNNSPTPMRHGVMNRQQKPHHLHGL